MSPSAFESVSTQGLGRLYDDQYALVDVSVTFAAGTATALLGPNGAGKSTLMGLLSTALRPSEGQVLFDGRPGDPSDAGLRARVGYLGHRPMLYGDLTAAENLTFFAGLYGISSNEVGARLAEVGLARVADRVVSGFSRGMAQRLALARALLARPSLLLLDEPFTGLDPEGVRIVKLLVEARRASGAVVVLVTHDLAVSDELVTHAVVLRNGRLAFAGASGGDLQALYREHATARERRDP